MDPQRFQRIEQLFLRALEQPPAIRAAWLETECGKDGELLREVTAMLAQDDTQDLASPSPVRGQLQSILDRSEGEHGAPPVPERIGSFGVTRRIGLGGMGAVYEAWQERPRRRVALKVIRQDAMSPAMLRRFRHEAELLGRLQHPGIAQIFEAGTFPTVEGDQPFFAMEFVDGLPLRRYAVNAGLGQRDRLELMARVCDAVHHAHQQGVLHRDLKSDNVLVTEGGTPKVVDFGVGRALEGDVEAVTAVTAAGMLIGTLAYMSPEQVRGHSQDVDTRADVYALGVVLYELLAERLPFDLDNVSLPEVGRILCEEDPPLLGGYVTSRSGDIQAIVSKALEKEKADRYQSASELALDIRRYLDDMPVQARPVTALYQLRKFARRNRVAFLGAVATAVALLIGIAATSIQAVRANRFAAEARENAEATARMAYRASISASDAALSLGDTVAAARHLNEAPVDLRRWEWHHLRSRIDNTAAVVDAGALPGSLPLQRQRIGFHRDGTPIVLCLEDGKAILRSVLDGSNWAAVDLGEAPTAVILSEDTSRLLAILATGAVGVWDPWTGAQLHKSQLPKAGPLIHLQMSADGKQIAVAYAKSMYFLRVDGQNEQSEPWTRYPLEYQDPYFAVAFARHDSWALVTACGFARIVDPATGEETRRVPLDRRSEVLVFSPDGSRIASGTNPQTHVTRILDPGSLEITGELGGHIQRATCAGFSTDGRMLATGSFGRVVIQETDQLRTERILNVAGVTPIALIWAPKGHSILVVGSRGEARLLAWRDAPFVELRGHTSFIYVAAWSPDGSLIASAGWDHTVRLWDPATGETLATWPIGAIYCTYVGFSPDGSTVFAGDGPVDKAWDVATGTTVVTKPPPGDPGERIRRVIRGNGRFVRGGGGGQAVANSPANTLSLRGDALLDLRSGVEQMSLVIETSVLGAAISHDDTVLATADRYGAIRLWHARDGSQRLSLASQPEIPGPNQSALGRTYTLDFHPDGARLVSGGDNGKTVLWDTATGRDVLTLQPHSNYVHVAAFSPDGGRLLTGSGDFTLRIWDSEPVRVRNARRREARVASASIRPWVAARMQVTGDPAAVAAQVRGSDRPAEEKRAALRALLEMCLKRR